MRFPLPERAATGRAADSIPPEEAGAAQAAGWLSPTGRFFPCRRAEHDTLAAELRRVGDGPSGKETFIEDRPAWVLVTDQGEVQGRPDLTQAQRDALGDLLASAPALSGYRLRLGASLRALAEMAASMQTAAARRERAEALAWCLASPRPAATLLRALRGARDGD